MTDFRISPLNDSSILYLYSEKDSIELNPDYQREGGIWSMEKKQLLIDSILNGYDIPKFYFHEFSPAKKIKGGGICKYAIVDGKQRLSAIWDFIENRICLDKDFSFFLDESVKAGGMTYSDLGAKYPKIKTRFDSKTLAVVSIQTEDLDLIEDMFSRLNEAVPLNAAEKRNAYGGPLPPVIRSLIKTDFFKSKLPITNTRYKHHDIVTKFLYLQSKGEIVDIKKVHLDNFVQNFPKAKKAKAEVLENSVAKILNEMKKVFIADDPLLKSIGILVVIYCLFMNPVHKGKKISVSRKILLDFEKKRIKNREVAELNISKADYNMLEFDRLGQSPNDGLAIQFRVGVLKEFLAK